MLTIFTEEFMRGAAFGVGAFGLLIALLAIPLPRKHTGLPEWDNPPPPPVKREGLNIVDTATGSTIRKT